jgi:hypothetical protein
VARRNSRVAAAGRDDDPGGWAASELFTGGSFPEEVRNATRAEVSPRGEFAKP